MMSTQRHRGLCKQHFSNIPDNENESCLRRTLISSVQAINESGFYHVIAAALINIIFGLKKVN